MSDIPLFIASQPIILANCVPQSGGIPVSGDTSFEFEVPSRKIHFAVGIVVNPEARINITGSTWTLTPLAGQTALIGKGANPPSPMQPVLNGAPLPDGYEGESGVKRWRAQVHLVLQTTTESNVVGAVIGQVIWEPVPSAIQMTAEERKYGFGFCTAARTGAVLTLGSGIP